MHKRVVQTILAWFPWSCCESETKQNPTSVNSYVMHDAYLASNLCGTTHGHGKVWSGNTSLQKGGEGEGGDRGTGC